MQTLTGSHSVGTVVRRDLHVSLEQYDTRYRILADSFFLRRARLTDRVFDHRDGPIPGSFATTGVSHRDHGHLMIESYSYNVECGSSPTLQAVMFVARPVRVHVVRQRSGAPLRGRGPRPARDGSRTPESRRTLRNPLQGTDLLAKLA